MRHTRHSTKTLISLIILTGLVWLVSCAPAKFEQDNGFNVTWPPQDTGRNVSDSSAVILGKNYANSGGNVMVQGDAVNIDSGTNFSWTMYSVGGLAGSVTVSSLQADANVTQAGTEPNTAVWIGLSNYTHNRWEWHKLDPAQTSNTHTYDSDDYISSGYKTYVVTLVFGGGSALLSQLQINIAGDITLMAPENLTATADVGQITLDWDDVYGAEKYNIYRALEPNFPTPELINTVDVTESTFVDTTVVQHKMYYYKVKAFRIYESSYSNMVDIYSPMVDQPLAQNVRVLDRTDTTIQFGWDAAGNPPGGWYVYYSDVPNFSLNTLSGQFSLPAYMRDTWLEDLDPAKTYYIRIAPRQSSSLGRMTDDLGSRVKGFWNWNESLLGTGSGPISLASHEGTKLDALYLLDNAIKMAEYSGGAWTIYDSPLDTSIDPVKDDNGQITFPGGFNYYLTSSYGNGMHVLLGHTMNSDDLFSATGNPGSWTTQRVSGDGSTDAGHNQSGEFCKVAGWDGGYAILDFFTVGTQGKLYTYNWSNSLTDTFTFTTSTPASWSMVHDGSKLNMLYWNASTNKLMQYNSSSGSAVEAGSTGIYNDVQMIDGNMMTPAQDVAGNLVALSYNGTGWASTTVADEASVQVGIDTKLVSDGGTGAAMAYRTSAYPRAWYFVVFDGTTWKTPQKLMIGTVTFTDDLDLAWADGKAWLMYRDMRRLNKIFVAWGEPPV